MAVKVIYSNETCEICGDKFWCIGFQKDKQDTVYICEGCLTNQIKYLTDLNTTFKKEEK